MKSKYIIGLVAVIIVGLIVIKLASNKKHINEKNKPVENKDVRIPVKVIAAQEQVLEISIKKTGSLVPFKEAKALATSSGSLTAVRFNLGDNVSEGQVLAVTDNRAQQLDLQKALTNAAKLKSDLQTYTDLLAGHAATQEKVNEIRQNYQDALTQVGQAKKSLGDALIKAPTSGTVTEKKVETGVAVSNGSEIATIVNLSQAKVDVNVTEAEVYQIHQGQPVKITADVYPGKVFTGKITYISPQADQTHNYQVEIQIANQGDALLRSGTFVNADFSKTMQQKSLVVPRDALTEGSGNASVFVIESGIAKLRNVTTGAEVNGKIQIVSGLKAGQQVVTSGQVNLTDGSKVNISK